MITKAITVASVRVLKEGIGRYGKWQLVRVTDQEGNGYVTFDRNFVGLGLVGQTVTVEVEDQEREFRGKIYHSQKIKLVACARCPLHCPA